MNNIKCARCLKTVYPTEELKCLDKVWHKVCFKCNECGMSLNMRNYKGFMKLPYCSSHIPQVKHTAVADTPESRRLAENTRIQSNVKYHEDFEKLKGKVTQVADDPETVRIRQTSKIISNVAYHGELEKKKQMEEKRSLLPDGNNSNGVEETSQITDGKLHVSSPAKQQNQQLQQTSTRMMACGDPNQNHQIQAPHDMSSNPQHLYHGSCINRDNTSILSKIQPNVIYTSNQGEVTDNPSRKIGSIADYDPLNNENNYGSIAAGYRTDYRAADPGAFYGGQPTNFAMQQTIIQPQLQQQPMLHRGVNVTRTYKAMYDYAAQDVDEVNFLDGDVIINCVPIDDGWMTGIVQRTGQSGMLPANYVEPFN